MLDREPSQCQKVILSTVSCKQCLKVRQLGSELASWRDNACQADATPTLDIIKGSHGIHF